MLFPVRICFTIRSDDTQRQAAIDAELELYNGDRWSVQAAKKVRGWLERFDRYQLISVDTVLLKEGDGWIPVPYNEEGFQL